MARHRPIPARRECGDNNVYGYVAYRIKPPADGRSRVAVARGADNILRRGCALALRTD